MCPIKDEKIYLRARESLERLLSLQGHIEIYWVSIFGADPCFQIIVRDPSMPSTFHDHGYNKAELLQRAFHWYIGLEPSAERIGRWNSMKINDTTGVL